MVFFSCESCQDTIKKPKLENHASWCRGPFTCIDCNTTFQGRDWKGHTKCITEEEKYQKGDLKGKQHKKPVAPPNTAAEVKAIQIGKKEVEKSENGVKEPKNAEDRKEKKSKKDKKGIDEKAKEDKPNASCGTGETEGGKKDRKEDNAANYKVEDERKKKNKKEKKGNKEDEKKKENKTRKSKRSKETSEELKPDRSSPEQQMNGGPAVKSKEKKSPRTVRMEEIEPQSDALPLSKKEKKRKAAELDIYDPETSSTPKKKKSKSIDKPTVEERITAEEPPIIPSDDDAPMYDLTTLLVPDLVTKSFSTEISSIHPSRMRNFTNTNTFADVDPSFLPRPQDIKRARRQLESNSDPKPKKQKLTLQEKREKRILKEAQKMEAPRQFVRKPIIPTREKIEDPLKHFVDGLTSEPQKMAELVSKCKADVKAGGDVLSVGKQLYKRLALRREGVSEDGKGGIIVMEVLERHEKEDDGDSDEDED